MRPRRVDLFYLLCVAVLAAVFVGDVLHRAYEGAGRDAAQTFGAAGTPRDVDVERLRELIRQGHLSDVEARHAHPVEGGSAEPPEPQPARDR